MVSAALEPVALEPAAVEPGAVPNNRPACVDRERALSGLRESLGVTCGTVKRALSQSDPARHGASGRRNPRRSGVEVAVLIAGSVVTFLLGCYSAFIAFILVIVLGMNAEFLL